MLALLAQAVVAVVLALWLVTGRLILLVLVMAVTVFQVQLLALLLYMLAAVLGPAAASLYTTATHDGGSDLTSQALAGLYGLSLPQAAALQDAVWRRRAALGQKALPRSQPRFPSPHAAAFRIRPKHAQNAPPPAHRRVSHRVA
jgi:hypothetical protein